MAKAVRVFLFNNCYGTERMRQKLFVVVFGVFVNVSGPNEPAGLVACGSQLGGDKL